MEVCRTRWQDGGLLSIGRWHVKQHAVEHCGRGDMLARKSKAWRTAALQLSRTS